MDHRSGEAVSGTEHGARNSPHSALGDRDTAATLIDPTEKIRGKLLP
jgi:hypothetical protein